MTAKNDDPAMAIIALALAYDRATAKPAKEAALKELAGLITALREAGTPDGNAMKEALIERDGLQCQGCGFEAPNKRHLELDHKVPKTDGGSDIIDNRVLLCGPCNRRKSNRLTLSGLLVENRKDGHMVNDPGARRPRKSPPEQRPEEAGADWNEPGITTDQKMARVVMDRGTDVKDAEAFALSGVDPKEHWRPGRARAVGRRAPERLAEVARGEVSLREAYETYGRQPRAGGAGGVGPDSRIADVFLARGPNHPDREVIKEAGLDWKDRWRISKGRAIARHDAEHDGGLLRAALRGTASFAKLYEDHVRPGGPRKPVEGAAP